MAKKKKRSVISEIKRATTGRSKSRFVPVTSYDGQSFGIEAPDTLENPQEHLERFSYLWYQVVKEAAPSLHLAKDAGQNKRQILTILVEKMREKFDNYLMDYSRVEQQFLIVSCVVDEWLILFDIFSSVDDSERLPRLVNENYERLIIGWVDYQVFKKYLSELNNTFEPLWSAMENIFFSQ
ncbi:MAG: hypothetical protein QNJ54_26860 [Prochloraceae cyanobacterium]|nr:hypothetical protein [Prochloraceae cyanobacterium]